MCGIPLKIKLLIYVMVTCKLPLLESVSVSLFARG